MNRKIERSYRVRKTHTKGSEDTCRLKKAVEDPEEEQVTECRGSWAPSYRRAAGEKYQTVWRG